MQQFWAAHAAADEAESALACCLEQLGQIPPETTLGFIYVTTATLKSLPGLLEQLRSQTPGVEWLGCCGDGICGAGVEYYDGPAIALLLTDIERPHFCTLSSRDDLGVALPEAVRQWCEEHPQGVGLIHAVPTYMACGAFADEVRRYAPQMSLNGGLSSSLGRYRHIHNGVAAQGISGVLFSERQTILSAHSQGCTPISDHFSVDAAQQNMVSRLSGRPALDVLRESVGEVLWREPQRLGNYIFIGLQTEPGSDDDYMVRNLMGLDWEGGAIAVGDLMESHQRLRFCRRDGNAARDDMVAMLQRLKQQLNGRTIRGGIYISCVGRGRRQFGEQSGELQLIAEQLGDFPLAGFFANGEFYNGRLYSYTGVLTLFL
ncbi:MAG: FIST C-terminal domain-containing protein [Chromatiales bacterium]|nr:FIST C-terminal domain-containing protein [Chromatiales bacterium]